MGKKKFIAKGEGQQYHLLHRSQRDEAYSKEGRPSEFVLVAAPGEVSGTNRKQVHFSDIEHLEIKDHITPLGFKNDGYDYTQHLKTMGGGMYISKDGKPLGVVAPEPLQLPSEALPSDVELERDLFAITISDEYMDDDIRAALFDGADDEGEFEELDDDFISQVKGEPETPDFDFDAHIAKLLEQSERSLEDTVGPRGWDTRPSGRFLKNLKLTEEDNFDDDEFSGDAFFEGNHCVESIGDEAFERTLGEYDDEMLGYISDADDDEVEGTIALDGEDLLFHSAMDEFLEEKKNEVFAEGIKVQKGSRSIDLKGLLGGTTTTEGDEAAEAVVDYKKEFDEQMKSQSESAAELRLPLGPAGPGPKGVPAMLAANEDDHGDLLTCQEYLRDVVIRDEWDCESVLSTYSTLDNHPALIKDPKSKFRPHKSRFTRAAEAAANRSISGSTHGDLDCSDTASISSHMTGRSGRSGKSSVTVLSRGISAGEYPTGSACMGSQSKPAQIILSGKLSLPQGFTSGGKKAGPVKTAKEFQQERDLSHTGNQGDSSSVSVAGGKKRGGRGPLATIRENGGEGEGDNDVPPASRHGGSDSDSASDGTEDGEDRDESMSMTSSARASTARPKGETPEERRLRKAMVKEERRLKRSTKRQLKETFKSEIVRSFCGPSTQATDRVSLFKYTT